jgi:hypothetical protein
MGCGRRFVSGFGGGGKIDYHWLQKHPSFVEQLKLQAVRFVEDSVAGGARSS